MELEPKNDGKLNEILFDLRVGNIDQTKAKKKILKLIKSLSTQSLKVKRRAYIRRNNPKCKKRYSRVSKVFE